MMRLPANLDWLENPPAAPSETQTDDGRRARDQGIERAAAHADRVQVEWTAQAYLALVEFLSLNGATKFATEDVRLATARLIPDPPDARAWGSVIKRAAKNGLIERAGFREHHDPSRHRGISTVWRRK